MRYRTHFWPVVTMTALCISFKAFPGDSLETSALAAWEQIQKNDPKVVTFKKTGDRTYDFSSSYFEYTGTIKVLAVDIDEGYGIDTSFPYHAVIDVEVAERPKSECVNFGRGYYRWAQLNSLHFNRDSGRWVTSTEYAKFAMKKSRETQMEYEKKDRALGNRLRPLLSFIILLILFVLGISFFTSLNHNVKLISVYQKEIIAQLKMLNERIKKE